MIIIVFITCVLASVFNAVSSLLEREAASAPNIGKLFSRQLIKSISTNNKFFLGIASQAFASLLEIIALSQGSLILVGPLLTLDLVFLWFFISHRYKLKISPKNWVAVAFVISGLSLFYISSDPQNNQSRYSLLPWVVAMAITIGIILGSIAIASSTKSARIKAGTLGMATACNYAINAGLVKLVLNQTKLSGAHGLFLTWPLYALIVFAIMSVILMQNTFSAGPLAISQPIIEIVEAMGSVLIGIFIFNNSFSKGWLSLAGDGLCLVLITSGIYTLATTKDLFTAKS